MKIDFEISIDELNKLICKEYNLKTIYFNSASPIFGRKTISIRAVQRRNLSKERKDGRPGK